MSDCSKFTLESQDVATILLVRFSLSNTLQKAHCFHCATLEIGSHFLCCGSVSLTRGNLVFSSYGFCSTLMKEETLSKLCFGRKNNFQIGSKMKMVPQPYGKTNTMTFSVLHYKYSNVCSIFSWLHNSVNISCPPIFRL